MSCTRSENRAREIARNIMEMVDKERGVTNNLVEEFCYQMCSMEEQNIFAGVYAVDEIPVDMLKRRRTFNVIVNLASRSQGETEGHFVIITAHPRTIVYIDPFGAPNLKSQISYFLRACRRPTMYNRTALQSYSSPFCGMYAALYATYFNNPDGRKIRLKWEKKNLRRNDHLCMKYLNELVNEIYDNA